MHKLEIVILLIQLVCALVFVSGLITTVVDRWYNNHFVDDKGRRYKRTMEGFRYY